MHSLQYSTVCWRFPALSNRQQHRILSTTTEWPDTTCSGTCLSFSLGILVSCWPLMMLLWIYEDPNSYLLIILLQGKDSDGQFLVDDPLICSCSWPTLETHRQGARFILLYKIIHGEAAVNIPDYIMRPSVLTR
jgi:hypothetical protein